jgi:hypothetical protein
MNADRLQGLQNCHAMKNFIALLMLVALAGCSSAPLYSVSHHQREVVLSGLHPQDDFLGARLVAIADDGTTTILCFQMGDYLQASPGGYFESDAYGREGLQLISASAEKHEARFIRRWAEAK